MTSKCKWTLNAENLTLKNDNNEKGNNFSTINAAAFYACSWKYLCTWQTCHDNNYDRAFSLCKLDLLLVRNSNRNRRKRIAMSKYEEINETGYSTCAKCGKRCCADDLSEDWLCEECAKCRCEFCHEKSNVLRFDKYYGWVCPECESWINDEKEVVSPSVLEIMDDFEVITTEYKLSKAY